MELLDLLVFFLFLFSLPVCLVIVAGDVLAIRMVGDDAVPADLSLAEYQVLLARKPEDVPGPGELSRG